MRAEEHEYTFDCKLWVVCRVTATSEKEARRKMLDVLDCFDVTYDKDGVVLTEASVEDESGETSELIEVDGQAV